jgi:hypothetical protein
MYRHAIRRVKRQALNQRTKWKGKIMLLCYERKTLCCAARGYLGQGDGENQELEQFKRYAVLQEREER